MGKQDNTNSMRDIERLIRKINEEITSRARKEYNKKRPDGKERRSVATDQEIARIKKLKAKKKELYAKKQEKEKARRIEKAKAEIAQKKARAEAAAKEKARKAKVASSKKDLTWQDLFDSSARLSSLDLKAEELADYKGSWKSPLEAAYSNLNSTIGRSLLGDRKQAMKLDTIIDPKQAIRAGAGAVIDGGHAFFNFVVHKEFDPQKMQQGFGNIVLKPGALQSMLGRGNEREQVETITAAFQFLDSTIQFQHGVASPDGKVTPSTSISRNVTSEDYLRRQAQNVVDIASGKLTRGEFAKRLTIDIETAGLDDGAGIWQVAMRAGEDAPVEELILNNQRMNLGLYEVDGVDVSFEEKLLREGKISSLDDIDSQMDGLRKVLGRMKESQIISGQNVKFDIDHILLNAEKLRGRSDSFDSLLDETTEHVLTKARIYDAKYMLQGVRKPVTDMLNYLKGKAGIKSLGQENTVLSTTLLEDALKRGYISQEMVDQIVTKGLHDAAVDVGTTGAIENLTFDTLSPGSGYEGLRDVLSEDEITALRSMSDDPEEALAILRQETNRRIGVEGLTEAVEDSHAIVPTHTRIGKETPLQKMIQATRSFDRPLDRLSFSAEYTRSRTFGDFYRTIVKGEGTKRWTAWKDLGGRQSDPDIDRLLYTPDPFRGSMSFDSLDMNNIAGEFGVEGLRDGHYTDMIPGLDGIGKTVQQKLAEAGANFAYIDKISRQAGALIGQVPVGGLSDAQRLISTEIGHLMGGSFYQGQTGIHMFSNLSIDPRLLGAISDLMGDESILGTAIEVDVDGNAQTVHRHRLSHTKYDNVSRANMMVDSFRNTDGAVDADRVNSFVAQIEMLAASADGPIDDSVLETLKARGLVDDTPESLEAFRVMMRELKSSEGYGSLAENIRGSAQYGVQVATFTDDGSGAIDELVELMMAIGEERDLDSDGLSVLVPDFGQEGQAGVGKMSVPIHTLTVEEQVQAAEEMIRTKATMDKLTEVAEVDPTRISTARGLTRTVLKDKSLPMVNFLKKNADEIKLSGAGLAAVGLGALLYRRERRQAQYEGTLEDEGAYGYETEEDYYNYKATMGEIPEREFQANPVSRLEGYGQMNPLETAGLVQDMSLNQTGHHRMGPKKDQHLFGGML